MEKEAKWIGSEGSSFGLFTFEDPIKNVALLAFVYWYSLQRYYTAKPWKRKYNLLYIIIFERLSKGDFFSLFCLIEILIVSKNKIFITTSATYDSKEVIFKPMEIWNWRVFFLSVSKENSNKYIKTFSSWTEPDEIPVIFIPLIFRAIW